MLDSLQRGLRRAIAALTPPSARVRARQRERAVAAASRAPALAWLRTFVPAEGLVFDVGANVGRKADLFRAIPARVVAIEPQPRCVAVLRELFAEDAGVAIEAVALGPEAGEAELLVADADTLSTLDPSFGEATRASGRFAAHRWSGRVRVPVRRLDELVARHGVPDYLKIDVEGFELQVLRGLSRPVPMTSVEFVPELWRRSVDCVGRLRELGPVEGNLVLGEETRFRYESWLAPDDLAAELEALSDRVDLFGDVYIRTAQR